MGGENLFWAEKVLLGDRFLEQSSAAWRGQQWGWHRVLRTRGTMTTSGKECAPELCLYSVSLDVLLKEVLGRSRGIGAMSICGLRGLHLELRASSSAENEPIHHLQCLRHSTKRAV